MLKKQFIVFTGLLFSISGCAGFDLYEVRAQFLPPVDYVGGICRMSDNLVHRLLSPDKKGNPQLLNRISAVLSRASRFYSFSVYDPVSETEIYWNPDLIFHGASTYKAGILVAYIKMASQKKISLNDRIPVNNRFFSVIDGTEFSLTDDEDKPDEIFKHVGESLPIQTLLHEMIAHSSNLATNLLIDYTGPGKINETLNELGLQLKVVRGVSDNKAYGECLNNTVSAGELLELYRLVYDKTKFNETDQATIVSILKDNDETGLIPGQLPEKTPVAHKPGNTSRVYHDAGIVLPEGESPYFISILLTDYKSKKKAARAIAEVSNLVYEEVLAERNQQKR